ncbi:hypothetical protein [Novosphingobium sp.]|uniref:hypothetical protein n=1 Tax=Novosphingobium sp. TaxID=1874826 RepID=UPI003BAA987A
MTAPASALPSSVAAAVPTQGAAPAAAASGARGAEMPGFAAHLAREVPAAADTLPTASLTLTAPVQAPALPTEAAITPDTPAEPGKTLPPARQKLAASPLAFTLVAAQVLSAAKPAASETQEPADKTASDQPETATTTLVLALTGAALPQFAPAAAPGSTKPTEAGVPAQGLTPAAPRAADAAAAPAPAAQAAHPAAFAVASLVFESEAAAVPAQQQPAPPDQAAPESATHNTARAQLSTLAALTGAPTPDRPAARKFRTEAELALPAAEIADLPAPETAAALALAQPTLAPAATLAAPAAAGAQPISFDQLVDSIARARDGLEPAGPVAVAMHHAEFGRISLRIEGDATGLSVALASPDPAFAPAVAAAHAAATAEPARVASASETSGQTLTQGQAQGQGQPGTGQQRQSAYTSASQRPAANPARSPASADERRGGIFA